MKGKLKKINGKWFVEYTGVSYSGGNPKQLGSYTKKVEQKRLELTPNNQRYLNYFLYVDKDTRVDFKEVFINPMGRQVDPNDLGQNHSGCVWYAELIYDENEEPKKVLTEEDIFNQRDIDAVTDYIDKETSKQEQKQHLIDMMESDEELGLYDEKIEDIELEEVRGSSHCQFSVVENKLAIIYRNQLKILQAIKMLNNGKRNQT